MKTLVYLLCFIIVSGSTYGQWTLQNSNTENNLNDLHFLNDSVGYVVGNSGTFLQTSDRGQTWLLSNIDPTKNLLAVFAIDQDTIFAAGAGRIYKTIDGGQNWNVMNSTLYVNELKFFSSQVGYAKVSWSEQCPYPNSGSATRHKYYRTLDGGHTWNYFELFEDHTVSAAEMEIVTQDTGYMGAMEIGFWCGYWPCCESASNYFYKTTDGGMTWQSLIPTYNSPYVFDVAFINGLEGFCTMVSYSPYGYLFPADLFSIQNGGTEITFVHELPDYTIGKLLFANAIEGYYLDGGKIMKTTTEGYFWEVDHDASTGIGDIVMTKNYEAYVIGMNGTILHKTLDPVTEPQALYWMNCNQNKLIFPPTNINEQAVMNFTLTASGNRDIQTEIAAPADFLVKVEGSDEYSQQISGLVIAAGHDTLIQVRFSPGGYALFNDTIMISSDASNNPLIKLPASGKGVCFLPQLVDIDTSFCFDTVWVRNHVTLNQGKSMTICPGTVVNFNGGYQFNIDGSLIAKGSPSDSIRFTCLNKWAGMYISASEPSDSVILEYCLLEHCDRNIFPETDNGGGLNIAGTAKVDVSHSTFSDCKADDSGGGIYCTGSGCSIKECNFYGCSSRNGGAIYYHGNKEKAIINCNILNCGSDDNGGGIYLNGNADSLIINCTFNGCSSGNGGGMYLTGDFYSVHSCTITNCSADYGGGILADNSGPSTIEGCTINNCNAYDGAGVQIYSTAKLTIQDCVISGCRSEYAGAGIHNSGASDNVIKNCTISENRVDHGDGGGIFAFFASPHILDNEIKGNQTFLGQGAGIACFYSSALIMNNRINNNSADSSGAGIYCEYTKASGTTRIVQNLLYRNYTTYANIGVSVYLKETPADILMNTITDNDSGWDDGIGIYLEDPEMTRIFGNIIYNNAPNEIEPGEDPGIILSYCDIKGGWGGTGEGNIDQYPEFYGLPFYPWYWINVDYSIMAASPCVDAGPLDTAGFNLPSRDLAGNPRFVNGRLDMGAYENNFLYQTIDTGFCEGVDFMIETVPLPGVTYSYNEWTFNGEIIPGEHNDQLVLTSPDDSDEGYYQHIYYGENSMVLHSRKIYLYNKGFAPEVQEQPIGAVLNEGDDYQMVFAIYSPDHATTYQWYMNDILLQGEDERVIFITNFSKTMQGTYTCKAENTCGALVSDGAILQLTPSSVDESSSSGFFLYPNPAGTELKVSISRPSSVANHHLPIRCEIFDMLGRKMMAMQEYGTFPLILDISVLRDGVYFLRINSKGEDWESVMFLKVTD